VHREIEQNIPCRFAKKSRVLEHVVAQSAFLINRLKEVGGVNNVALFPVSTYGLDLRL